MVQFFFEVGKSGVCFRSSKKIAFLRQKMRVLNNLYSILMPQLPYKTQSNMAINRARFCVCTPSSVGGVNTGRQIYIEGIAVCGIDMLVYSYQFYCNILYF